MAIEAPISKFKKTNFKVYIAVCIVAAIWFGYDGYYNKKFIDKHSPEGVPDTTLIFNQKSPPVFIGAALLLGAYLFVISRKKVLADENELVINAREEIPYDSIQTIDKTHFSSKGFFIITYKDNSGSEIQRKLSKKTFDNLAPILDHLVEKIS